MRLLNPVLFILFNIYLIESANRTDSVSDLSEGDRDKSDKSDEVLYEEYDHEDGKQENSISGKVDKSKISSTESEDSGDGFPNEVFLSLRNITADAATAFRSFTHRNDVADLQASASDNLNVTASSNLADAESAGISLRALRDAGHPPVIIEDTLGVVHAPYKHAKIDTADLSDCALQGEWKPMGVAHGHVQVDGDHSQQAEILQSVGSYAVPNKVIPHWGQHQVAGEQIIQDVARKPFAGGGGHAYASGYGSGGFGGSSGDHSHLAGYGLGSGSGLGGNNGGLAHASGGGFGGNLGSEAAHDHSGHGSGSGYGGSNGGGYAYAAGYGGHIGIESNHQNVGFPSGGLGQKIRHSMLSPPPVPPIIFGKKPGYWKIPKSKHKYMHGKNKRPSGSFGFSGYVNHAPAHGGIRSQGGSGYRGISGGSSNLGHVSVGYGSGGIQGNLGHIKYGFGGMSSGLNPGSGGVSGIASGDYGVASVQGLGPTGVPVAIGSGHGAEMSLSGDHGTAGIVSSGQAVVKGATAGHLIAEHDSGVQALSSGSNLESLGYAQGSGEDHLIAAATLGSGDDLSAHAAQPGNGGSAHIVTINQGGSIHPEAYVSNPPAANIHDSTFSSTHIIQGGNSQFLANGYLSNQDLAVHGQGAADGLSSSSTFTCGKNHDHNTNYHTATFQVADHDHPSSVDILRYGGDATVLIQSGDTSFHDQILPERKHYKTTHLSDAEASGSDNTNELSSQAALTSQTEQNGVQTESELIKTDDGEEPERHSYYHEITKVTKIPATSVGSIQKYYSQYETKPQIFTTETEPAHEEEEEVDQPQIIRELEHLSNKFQLDLENPQKLFEDPPNQELTYHYPFQEEQVGGKIEGVKEGEQEGITEFPYKFFQNVNRQPVVHHKRPPIKYIPRPGKIAHEKPINYIHPKPVLVVRKHKPKQFLKKQNYEVIEHGGERHRPVGEIFPPQKFPKQFHNPRPNFAVDRPKKGWRPEYQEYKYDYSHGKKIRKFKTKAKVVAPVIIRRPVSPAPVLRVVEVAG